MIAVALSPQARALIRAHRDERRPTTADRERVAAALRERLGAQVLPLDTPLSGRLMSRAQRFATACGLCVAGTVLFLARRPEAALESTPRTPDKTVEMAPAEAAAPVPISASESPGATVAAGQAAPVAAQYARPKPASMAPVQDTLGQELRLLTSAASGLSSGQPSAALLALQDHERRFPHGVLTAERNVAKARALCMLRRFDEGRAVLARIGTGTPAAARVKEECDLAWARAKADNASRKLESD